MKGMRKTPSSRRAICFRSPTNHRSPCRGSNARFHCETTPRRREPPPLGHSQARHRAPRQVLPLQQFFLDHQDAVFTKEQTRPGEQRVRDEFIDEDLATTAAASTGGCHHHRLATAERALLGVLRLSSVFSVSPRWVSTRVARRR